MKSNKSGGLSKDSALPITDENMSIGTDVPSRENIYDDDVDEKMSCNEGNKISKSIYVNI